MVIGRNSRFSQRIYADKPLVRGGLLLYCVRFIFFSTLVKLKIKNGGDLYGMNAVIKLRNEH